MQTRDAIDAGIAMMAECLEIYAEEGGTGFDAIEAMAGAEEFGRWVSDVILEEMGVV